MLGDITCADEVMLVTGYTDMRKSIDGLYNIIKDQMNTEPESRRALYLFCGRRCDRIKILIHEPDGWVLLYKKLHRDYGRYKWPRNKSEVKPITWKQLDWLLSGLDIDQPKAIKDH